MARTTARTSGNDNEDRGADVAGAAELAADVDGGRPEPADVIEATIISGPDVPTTAIAHRGGDGVEVEGYVAANHPAMVMLNTWLNEHVSVGNDSDMAVAEIIAQVLSADSLDEVLADHQAVSMRDLLGEPLRIHKVKPLRSAYESNAPWFFYCDVEKIGSGERVGVTTGAQTVVAQLVRVAMLDGYPFDCVPINATKKPTANGYWPYKLTAHKPITAE